MVYLSATKAAEDSGSEDGNSVNSVAAAWAFFWQMPRSGALCARLLSVGGQQPIR